MFAALISFLYELLYWIFAGLMTVLFGFRVEHRRRIPRIGPVLFIANHQSYLDIFPLGLASTRRVFFLAKKPLFQIPLLGSTMRAFDVVEIDHVGMSRGGLEGILSHLKNGKAGLIFPEGERCWDGKVSELRPGVSLLIRKAKCPVVVLGLSGAFEGWPRFKTLPRLLRTTRKRVLANNTFAMGISATGPDSG